MQFNLIICGLDSVEARRWINATLVNMVDSDNPESLKPLIDGGTEGMLCIPPICIEADPHVIRRIQGPSTCHSPHRHVLLRVFSRHVEQAYSIPDMYHCQHTSSTRTLHRVGIRTRMAKGSWR